MKPPRKNPIVPLAKPGAVANTLHIDLDGAWPRAAIGGSYHDARAWGPRLRYSTSAEELESFAAETPGGGRTFTLFGSGDFHHLAALWIRRVEEKVTVISFDNHPDWDTRPPRWGCGTWLNRALEFPHVEAAAIWGCGNFELNWPGHLFTDRGALATGRLRVWPWTERLAASGQRRFPGITPLDWRAQFQAFAAQLAGRRLYVTVDLDCLDAAESATNWEPGLFAAADIAWALRELRAHGEIIGGDLCGAASPARYARWGQRLLAKWDHPRQTEPDSKESAARNGRALATIWPALTVG